MHKEITEALNIFVLTTNFQKFQEIEYFDAGLVDW